MIVSCGRLCEVYGTSLHLLVVEHDLAHDTYGLCSRQQCYTDVGCTRRYSISSMIFSRKLPVALAIYSGVSCTNGCLSSVCCVRLIASYFSSRFASQPLPAASADLDSTDVTSASIAICSSISFVDVVKLWTTKRHCLPGDEDHSTCATDTVHAHAKTLLLLRRPTHLYTRPLDGRMLVSDDPAYSRPRSLVRRREIRRESCMLHTFSSSTSLAPHIFRLNFSCSLPPLASCRQLSFVWLPRCSVLCST